MRRIVRPLDRYVFTEWMKIFLSTALGLPILLVIIDLTDHLQAYLDRNIPPADIALSYVYWMPQSMFQALPAAVLFATVFSIGNMTRHSEVTAAKASGMSFYRLVAPIMLGAFIAAGIDLMIGELSPFTDQRRNELLGESRVGSGTQRSNFAYAAEYGRVYKAQSLEVTQGQIDQMQIERKGKGVDYPTVLTSALSARWSPGSKSQREGWTLQQGEMHVIRDSLPSFTMSFATLRDNRFTEKPADLLAKPRDPKEMRYQELSRFIGALERSGGDAALLRVERALKIAIPVTCLVIALFGAPLATSTQRGGTAYGIGISLATTVTFLMMIQLTKGVGGKNLLPPDLAAWVPNVLFALMGTVLLVRVRT